VGRLVTRKQLWAEDGLSVYRNFFNVMAEPVGGDGVFRNIEVFPPHSDWERRIKARMVLFETSKTRFDLASPHLVSRYDPASGPPDRWEPDPMSQEIERLLFAKTRRRLRTSATGYQHARYRATEWGTETRRLRDALFEVAHLNPTT
jgi:hypothetical protein